MSAFSKLTALLRGGSTDGEAEADAEARLTRLVDAFEAPDADPDFIRAQYAAGHDLPEAIAALRTSHIEAIAALRTSHVEALAGLDVANAELTETLAAAKAAIAEHGTQVATLEATIADRDKAVADATARPVVKTIEADLKATTDDPEAQVDADEAEWKASETLQADFTTASSYAAYTRADRAGRIR